MENKIFKQFSEKGYKHFTENTIEELDNLSLDDSDIITEFAHLCEWLRVKHGIWVYSYTNGKIWYACIQHAFGDMVELPSRLGEHNSPQEAYSAAFDYILNNLI
jgi:hypothetical protein